MKFINYPFDPILLNFMDNFIKFPIYILFLTFCVYFVNKQLKKQSDEDAKNDKEDVFAFLKFFPQGLILSIIYLIYFIIFQILFLYLPFWLKIILSLLFILVAPFILISYAENLKITDALNIKKILSRIWRKTHLYIYTLLLISVLNAVQIVISIIEWRTVYTVFSHGFISDYISLSILALFLSICTQIYSPNQENSEYKINISNKKKITVTIFVIIIPLIIISLPVFALWYLSWSPGFFWDGPYYGIERAKCPVTKPDQTVKIWNKMTLNVYDKIGNDIAPTIQVLDANDKQQLCMYVTETYKEPKKHEILKNKSSVKLIRFLNNYNSVFFYNKPRIKGSVDWSGGPEGAIWIFNRNGKLEEYYFSW